MKYAGMELYAHGHPRAGAEVLARVVRWYRDRPSYREDPRSRGEATERVAFASALLWLDSLDAARSVLERLLDEKVAVHLNRSDSAGVLIRLADMAVQQGDMAEGRRLAAELESFGLNSRAAVAAVLGDRDLAVRLLGQQMQRRFAGTTHMHMHFRSLYDYPPFQELMRPKG